MSLRQGFVTREKYDEKGEAKISNDGVESGIVVDPLEKNEVFKKVDDGVDFKIVGWPRASVIFLKGMLDQTPGYDCLLIEYSPFLDRGSIHPNRSLFSRRAPWWSVDRSLGSTKHLLGNRTGKL